MTDGSYFAVIPSSVMYDKRLKPIERLLYGTITLLTRNDGYCYATNKYLAELYECTEVAMSNYISDLNKYGYIRIEDGNSYKRKIYVDMVRKQETAETLPAKKPKKRVKKHQYGQYNNVLLSDEELEKLKSEFPDWQERIENVSGYCESTGKTYKNYLATIRNWSRRDKDKTYNPFARNDAQAGFAGALELTGGLIDE